jgi:tRNA(Ile)-lysidine synthase
LRNSSIALTLRPTDLLEPLQPFRERQRWVLGLSGGLDSVVLLHLLRSLQKREQLPALVALHVNHQLSDGADTWSGYCQRLCRKLDVELIVRRAEVVPGGRGPEAAARDARYQVFEDVVRENETLLLAHHLDDQVETFFLRLLRGAGTQGLSGMPAQRSLARGELFRPLLGFRREQLHEYASAHKLQWVEDDSNADTQLNRNYLRRQVLPLLEQRWPGYRSSVMRGVDAIRDAETQLREQQAERLRGATGEDFGEATLQLSALDDLAREDSSRLLRSWLKQLQLPNPGRDQLREFLQQLAQARPAARPKLETASYVVRRYRDKLYTSRSFTNEALLVGQGLKPGRSLTMPGLGRLELIPARGAGLRADLAAELQLGFRDGGERCRPVGREHSQSLKKLLQEYRVPPWWRDRLPLLVVGDNLVAVADLWVCAGFEAKAGQRGYTVRWQRNSLLPSD